MAILQNYVSRYFSVVGVPVRGQRTQHPCLVHFGDDVVTPSGLALGAGLLMAQPACLAGHGGVDRHRFAGLWARQHQFWPGCGRWFGAVVPELGRGRLLVGSASELAARLARTRCGCGLDDVGHRGVVGIEFGVLRLWPVEVSNKTNIAAGQRSSPTGWAPTQNASPSSRHTLPIAHGVGSYKINAQTVQRITVSASGGPQSSRHPRRPP